MIEDGLSITSSSGPECWPHTLKKLQTVRWLGALNQLNMQGSGAEAGKHRYKSPTARPLHTSLSARIVWHWKFDVWKLRKHLTGRRQLWFNMVLSSARNFKIQTWRFQGVPFHLKWRSKATAARDAPCAGGYTFSDGPLKLAWNKVSQNLASTAVIIPKNTA